MLVRDWELDFDLGWGWRGGSAGDDGGADAGGGAVVVFAAAVALVFFGAVAGFAVDDRGRTTEEEIDNQLLSIR